MTKGSSASWSLWMKLRLMQQLELQGEHLELCELPWAVVYSTTWWPGQWEGKVCRIDGIRTGLGCELCTIAALQCNQVWLRLWLLALPLARGGVSLWLYCGLSLSAYAIVYPWRASTWTESFCIPQLTKIFTGLGYHLLSLCRFSQSDCFCRVVASSDTWP